MLKRKKEKKKKDGRTFVKGFRIYKKGSIAHLLFLKKGTVLSLKDITNFFPLIGDIYTTLLELLSDDKPSINKVVLLFQVFSVTGSSPG